MVLPNKRASLFLQNHLSNLISEPVWLPKIIGTAQLIEELTNAQIVDDDVVLLFELYQVYTQIEHSPESFDDFSKWGQNLLQDFNEIDRYLIPTDQLFNHITEIKAIEVWNVGGEKLTDLQKKYLAFWNQLGVLYHKYTQHLLSKKLLYQGLAYRNIIEELSANPEDFIQSKFKTKKLLFVGFNALNKAEEILIDVLKKQGKCEVIFDADEYFFRPEQESGLFLRKFKKKWGEKCFEFQGNQLKNKKKKIHVIGVPQTIGQAKYLTELLENIEENELTQTAIVLADESLLVPVLQSLPDNIDNVNVTMGYRLRNTPLSNFFKQYFSTMVNAERYGNNNDLVYYHSDITKFFSLPFTKQLFGKNTCQTVINKLIEKNWVFINKDKLDWINHQISIPFSEKLNTSRLLECAMEFIKQSKEFYKHQDNNNFNLELEYLFQFAKLFKQLSTLLKQYPYIETAKSLYNLFTQLLFEYSIDLYGEPLQGLQVLGVLETRNIDFKNVILLSANEGVLPVGKTYNSFIPYDVKKYYNLPTHKEKDAVYAYHFYRLVQNASKMTILYNTATDEMGSGEKSRFITQIENELTKYNPQFNYKQNLLSYPIYTKIVSQILVDKNQIIINKIHQLFNHGLSPTALTTYLNCPLDFYFKYILGIREDDEVDETIQHNDFGEIVHHSLENLYLPYKNQILIVKDIDVMLQLVNETVLKFFKQKYSHKELSYGKNLLSLKVAQNYVISFLKAEQRSIQQGNEIVIKALEEKFSSTIEFDGIAIKLSGKADRIDTFNEHLRVIDYKTGTVNPADLKITKLEDIIEKNKFKAFQILMYAYLYKQKSEFNSLSAGIISFKRLKNGFMPFGQQINARNYNYNIDDNLLKDFEKFTKEIIAEIVNIEIPFTHREKAEYCEFCGK